MNSIRILPKKCATFRVKQGEHETLEHEIRPVDRMILQDAPAWIQDDPLYGWMVRDGSLEVVEAVNKAAKQPQEEETPSPVNETIPNEEQPQEEETKKRGRKTT